MFREPRAQSLLRLVGRRRTARCIIKCFTPMSSTEREKTHLIWCLLVCWMFRNPHHAVIWEQFEIEYHMQDWELGSNFHCWCLRSRRKGVTEILSWFKTAAFLVFSNFIDDGISLRLEHDQFVMVGGLNWPQCGLSPTRTNRFFLCYYWRGHSACDISFCGIIGALSVSLHCFFSSQFNQALFLLWRQSAISYLSPAAVLWRHIPGN